MSEFFKVDPNGPDFSYYIAFATRYLNSHGNSDNYISNYLGITREEYRNHILEISNAYQNVGEIYFHKEEDAAPVIEWLDALMVAKKLRGMDDDKV